MCSTLYPFIAASGWRLGRCREAHDPSKQLLTTGTEIDDALDVIRLEARRPIADGMIYVSQETLTAKS